MEAEGISEAVENLKAADASLQLDMMTQADEDLSGTWQQLLNEQITGHQDDQVIARGSSVIVGTTGFIVYAAQSSQPLSGGLVPSDNWFAVEFGARTRRMTMQTTSRKGNKYMVTKMINRGLPNRQKYGRVGFRAASEMGTELVRTWMDVMVSLYRDAVGDETRG